MRCPGDGPGDRKPDCRLLRLKPRLFPIDWAPGTRAFRCDGRGFTMVTLAFKDPARISLYPPSPAIPARSGEPPLHSSARRSAGVFTRFLSWKPKQVTSGKGGARRIQFRPKERASGYPARQPAE